MTKRPRSRRIVVGLPLLCAAVLALASCGDEEGDAGSAGPVGWQALSEQTRGNLASAVRGDTLANRDLTAGQAICTAKHLAEDFTAEDIDASLAGDPPSAVAEAAGICVSEQP